MVRITDHPNMTSFDIMDIEQEILKTKNPHHRVFLQTIYGCPVNLLLS